MPEESQCFCWNRAQLKVVHFGASPQAKFCLSSAVCFLCVWWLQFLPLTLPGVTDPCVDDSALILFFPHPPSAVPFPLPSCCFPISAAVEVLLCTAGKAHGTGQAQSAFYFWDCLGLPGAERPGGGPKNAEQGIGLHQVGRVDENSSGRHRDNKWPEAKEFVTSSSGESRDSSLPWADPAI